MSWTIFTGTGKSKYAPLSVVSHKEACSLVALARYMGGQLTSNSAHLPHSTWLRQITANMKSVFSFATLVTSVLAASRTSAPSGCITAGSGGTYSTVQKAVDSLSTTSTTAQCIFIEAGTYKEQVVVSSRAAQLTFYGYTEDTLSYSANQVTITNNLAAASGLTDDETGTLRVQATNFKAYNINIVNSYGKGSQAIALSAYAASGYYACQIKGYQDTVLAQTGNQLYAQSYIEGATDFVFGQYATAWFDECDIGVLTASLGTITGESVWTFLIGEPHHC